MINEFTVKIQRDSHGNQLSLSNISIESADALKVLIEALSDFAKCQDPASGTKLSLENGSIAASLVYSDPNITAEIDSVLEGTSDKKLNIKPLKAIQDMIKLNGLQYAVVHRVGNNSRDVTEIFKSDNFPSRRGPRVKYKEEVQFIQGKLFESGGKTRANVHLEGVAQEYTVQCTQEQAIVLNSKLYQQIYLSVIKKWRPGNSIKPEFIFIDSYEEQASFDEFRNFFQSIKANESLERFDEVHNRLLSWIEEDYIQDKEIIKLMKLYSFAHSDRGIVRTILMTLKPIVSIREQLAPIYNSLADILRSGNKSNLS